MSRNRSLQQDAFLEELREKRAAVAVYLTNGIRLHGRVQAFDQFAIVIANGSNHLVYKHAISSVIPASEGQRRGASAPDAPDCPGRRNKT